MAREGGKDRGVFEVPKKDPKTRRVLRDSNGKTIGSGVYAIEWADKNKNPHVEIVGRSKSAAKQLYIKRKEDVRLGKKLGPLNRRDITVGELIDKYASEFETNQKPRAFVETKRHAEFMRQAFGDREAVDLTPGEIEAWKTKRLKDVVGGTTNRTLAYLKALYNLAIRDELVTMNPLAAKRVKMMREADAPDRILSLEEERQLAVHLSRRDWLAMVICVQTGLRLNEYLSRRRSDVKLKKRRIALENTKADRAVGDTNPIEFVRLNDQALAALRELLESHDSEWLHPNRLGTGPDTASGLYHRFVRACGKLGMKDVDWHTLRHTFISRLVMMGKSLKVVQKLARHKSLAMTMRYAHHAPGDEEAAIADLGSVYGSYQLAEPPAKPTSHDEGGS